MLVRSLPSLCVVTPRAAGMLAFGLFECRQPLDNPLRKRGIRALGAVACEPCPYPPDPLW
jgi:hypothetical protein